MILVYDETGTKSVTINEQNEINRGGEGIILEYNQNYVAKIYHPNVKPLSKSKFIELQELQSNFFIKPEQLLYDKKGSVVGFLMNKVTSEYYPLMSLFNKQFVIRNNITDSIKKSIIDKLIEGVKYAHSKNILIGDLNPLNILVNNSGSIFFIDVDSYETKSHKHSNVLLEDIRDFYCGGNVNVNSDCFALSVLIFNLMTYVHPFKGVSKTTPKLGDRMIKKESVLNKNANVIIPKCYEPLSDKNILAQFESIFNNGNRFVISLNQISTVQTIAKRKVKVVSSGSLIETEMFDGDSISMSFATNDRLLVLLSTGRLHVYNMSAKNTFSLLKMYDGVECSDITCYGDDVYIYNKGKFICMKTNETLLDIGNEKYFKTQTFGSIFAIVTPDKMFKINLSKRIGNHIKYDIVSLFGSAIIAKNALFQNVSHNTLMFYDNANTLNTAMIDKVLLDLKQDGNCGVLSYIQDEKINIKYFTIKNLKVSLFDSDLTGVTNISSLNESLLIVPKDAAIEFVRKEDMQVVAKFDSDLVTENQTTLYATNAGIVAVGLDTIHLINKK